MSDEIISMIHGGLSDWYVRFSIGLIVIGLLIRATVADAFDAIDKGLKDFE